MTELVHTAIEAKGISPEALYMLATALCYAAAHEDVRCHQMTLADFATLAGVVDPSSQTIKRIISEAQKVLIIQDIFNLSPSGRRTSLLKSSSSQLLGLVAADGASVWFEVHSFILEDEMLREVLSLLGERYELLTADTFGRLSTTRLPWLR